MNNNNIVNNRGSILHSIVHWFLRFYTYAHRNYIKEIFDINILAFDLTAISKTFPG